MRRQKKKKKRVPTSVTRWHLFARDIYKMTAYDGGRADVKI